MKRKIIVFLAVGIVIVGSFLTIFSNQSNVETVELSTLEQLRVTFNELDEENSLLEQMHKIARKKEKLKNEVKQLKKLLKNNGIDVEDHFLEEQEPLPQREKVEEHFSNGFPSWDHYLTLNETKTAQDMLELGDGNMECTLGGGYYDEKKGETLDHEMCICRSFECGLTISLPERYECTLDAPPLRLVTAPPSASASDARKER